MKKKHKALKITLLSVLSFFVIIFCSMAIYVSIYNHASDDNDVYLKSDETVDVAVDSKTYEFKSKEKESTKGLIFYPGAKVEYTAYAPILYQLTKETGISCFLPHMTFNMAFLSSNKADDILKENKDITDWYIAGHSLGGAMACNYLRRNGDKFKGLILEASYSVYDLTSFENLSTLLLRASNDEVLNIEKYESGLKYLKDPKELVIEGGIHSFFGNYGIQKGDGIPTITKEEQWSWNVKAISEFIG